jgi:hypothetical protein
MAGAFPRCDLGHISYARIVRISLHEYARVALSLRELRWDRRTYGAVARPGLRHSCNLSQGRRWMSIRCNGSASSRPGVQGHLGTGRISSDPPDEPGKHTMIPQAH